MKSSKELGFLFGVLTGILLIFLIRWYKKRRNKKCEYDERQANARGKAAQLGFVSLIFLLLSDSLLKDFIEIKMLDSFSEHYLMIMISILIFIGYCIFHDAYLSISENPKQILRFLTATFLFEIVLLIISFCQLDADRKMLFMQIVATISVFMCILMLGIRQWMLKKEAE